MVDFDDKLFWIGRRGWPANAYGYVFLGEAVAQLGKALFPAEWTGAEMVAEAPYPRDGLYIDGAEGNAPKPRFWSEPRLIDVLARVLRENHPDIEIRYTPGHSRRPALTDEQHMAALLTIERVNPIPTPSASISRRMQAGRVGFLAQSRLRSIRFACSN